VKTSSDAVVTEISSDLPIAPLKGIATCDLDHSLVMRSVASNLKVVFFSSALAECKGFVEEEDTTR
jgi:hypothetical protein